MPIASHTAEESAHTSAQYPAMGGLMGQIIQLARIHVLNNFGFPCRVRCEHLDYPIR